MGLEIEKHADLDLGSLVEALASQGVDQRVIDEVVGHQTEEQRRRYRHPYPGVLRVAVARVFG
jgi:hypothetical protein